MGNATLFDGLSADTIRNVFRFFSESPHGSCWEGFVDFDDLRQLYLGEGALSEMCRRSYPAIQLEMPPRRVGGLKINMSSIAEVISAGGPHITSLSLDFPLLSGVLFVSAIQKYCHNLKELRVVADECHGLPHLLQGISSQLSSLSLKYKPTPLDMKIIGMRCQGLRKLEFHFPDYGNLEGMDKLFAAVGPGLEYLGIRGHISYPSFFRFVEMHCRSLCALQIDNFRHDLGNAFVDLVGSYSTQLEKLEIGAGKNRTDELSLSQYQEIVVMCPDVNCTVACRWDEAAVVMTGLAGRLVGMHLPSSYSTDRMAALQIASANCSRLREINCICKRDNIESLKKLLSLVKESLVSLCLDVRMSDTFQEDSDSEWEDLTVRAANYYHEERTRILRQLGPACEFLEIVILNFAMGDLTPRADFCKDVANVFSACPHLKQLRAGSEVDDDEKRDCVQDACNDWSQKSKSVKFVCLFGFQYLPQLK